MPGFTTDLIEGLADWLATQVSTLTWKPTQTYTATETGLYVWSLPATPDRGVGLALYATDDGPIVAHRLTDVMTELIRSNFRPDALLEPRSTGTDPRADWSPTVAIVRGRKQGI